MGTPTGQTWPEGLTLAERMGFRFPPHMQPVRALPWSLSLCFVAGWLCLLCRHYDCLSCIVYSDIAVGRVAPGWKEDCGMRK